MTTKLFMLVYENKSNNRIPTSIKFLQNDNSTNTLRQFLSSGDSVLRSVKNHQNITRTLLFNLGCAYLCLSCKNKKKDFLKIGERVRFPNNSHFRHLFLSKLGKRLFYCFYKAKILLKSVY